MQKWSNLSGFLEKSTGASHGDEYSCIAPASNNSSNYFLTSNYSWGLCLYIDFCTGLVPSTSGISCISLSFWLGSSHVVNVPGNTSQYLHNTLHNNALFYSPIFSKCGIAPSGRSLSPYNTSYRNSTGFPDVFKYFLYVMWEPLIVPSGNLCYTSITLVDRFS